MRLFTVKGDRNGFVFKESKQVFPMVRAEITAHIMFEFTPTTLLEWNRLSEKERKNLIRTVADEEFKVEDFKVKILES